MFGKKPSEYIRLERWILILIVVVFAIRLSLSLAGMTIEQIRLVSLNIVLLIGMIYASIKVHTSGFGGYKNLLGLLFLQAALTESLIALGIVLGIVTGHDNIFTVPEVFGGQDGKTYSLAFSVFF